jgi:anthranilate synthase component 2
MKLLMIDNYDSFTYNIVQYFGELGAEVEVFRNDEITVEGMAARKSRPAGGVARPVLAGRGRHLGGGDPAFHAGKLPILGVCLGHQSIGAAFGGKIIRAQQLMHGKTSVITTTQRGVLQICPNNSPSTATTRWRSSAPRVRPIWKSRPGPTTARSWACATRVCRRTRIEGVQFHPESILTEHGHAMLKNFLEMPA